LILKAPQCTQPQIQDFRILITGCDNTSLLSVIVSCAGDTLLAKNIYDYMFSKISPTSDTIYISLSEDEIEIVTEKLNVSSESIRSLLNAYVRSNNRLSEYSVIKINDVLVVGIRKNLDEMTPYCDMCGYIAVSGEDLNLHKRTHSFTM
jgi:hypothetical protein